LRLFVDQIRDSGMVLEGEEPVAELVRHFARITGEELLFDKPLHYALRALKVDDLIEIEGHLGTEFRLACSRCLNEFVQPLQADFSVTFIRQDKFTPEDVDEEGL